jgi:hypothetical protein
MALVLRSPQCSLLAGLDAITSCRLQQQHQGHQGAAGQRGHAKCNHHRGGHVRSHTPACSRALLRHLRMLSSKLLRPTLYVYLLTYSLGRQLYTSPPKRATSTSPSCLLSTTQTLIGWTRCEATVQCISLLALIVHACAMCNCLFCPQNKDTPLDRAVILGCDAVAAYLREKGAK